MNSSITRNGSTTQACAACKYQRRKCGPNCILAPYFPHDRQKQFLNAHKLFGVGRISNTVKAVEPPLRDTAMRTIIYQADMRAVDPVGGCYRIIQQLQSQIEYYTAELHLTLQHLAILRAQQANQHHCDIIINPDVNVPVPVPPTGHYHYVEQITQHDPYVVNPNLYNPLQEDVNMWANSIPLSPLSLQDKREEGGLGDYQNDQKPILDLINEMNSDTSTSFNPVQR